MNCGIKEHFNHNHNAICRIGEVAVIGDNKKVISFEILVTNLISYADLCTYFSIVTWVNDIKADINKEVGLRVDGNDCTFSCLCYCFSLIICIYLVNVTHLCWGHKRLFIWFWMSFTTNHDHAFNFRYLIRRIRFFKRKTSYR